jgi:hypothetical protein
MLYHKKVLRTFLEEKEDGNFLKDIPPTKRIKREELQGKSYCRKELY